MSHLKIGSEEGLNKIVNKLTNSVQQIAGELSRKCLMIRSLYFPPVQGYLRLYKDNCQTFGIKYPMAIAQGWTCMI